MTPTEKITNQCIVELRKVKETLSGDDSTLNNAWEEICVQVQDEYSYCWSAYEELIEATVHEVAAKQSSEVDETEVKNELLRVAADYSNPNIRKYIESRY